MELRGEAFDEGAEIDAVFGEEIEGGHLSAEDEFDIDELHGQIEFFDSGFAGGEVAAFFGLDASLLLEVSRGGDAEDSAVGGVGIVVAAGLLEVILDLLSGEAFWGWGGRVGGGEDLGQFCAASSADDDFGIAVGPGGAVIGEFADEAHGPVADQEGLWGGGCGLLNGGFVDGHGLVVDLASD